jgi:hypothetical protein
METYALEAQDVAPGDVLVVAGERAATGEIMAVRTEVIRVVHRDREVELYTKLFRYRSGRPLPLWYQRGRLVTVER